jgi:3-dehydroquinate synthase
MHDIVFENDAFTGLKSFLEIRQNSSLIVLTDENTHKLCLPVLEKVLSANNFQVIQISAGEQFKNLDSCRIVWSELLKNNADRHSVLINLGGGVIGDLGGFCAATYKRGIDFIQIPTTLLAMVDASVGGKTGIDFNNIKNAVGIITDPSLVCINHIFLKTLPARELLSGFAEIIKHALIADEKYWNSIKSLKTEAIPFGNFIQRSVEIKKSIVAIDPREKGLRKILNFGHTIGHAIESMSWETENPLLHGEAIAIGMICESYISNQKTGLDAESLNEICNLIFNFYKPYNLPGLDKGRFFEFILQDKKNQKNSINLSLLKKIGDCTFDIPVEKKLLEESLDWYCKMVNL